MPAPQIAMPTAPRTDAELSEFLMRACHDLRGPLRTVRIYSELMAKNRTAVGDHDNDQSLGFMANGATSAGAVVDGITDYALALAIDPARFQPALLDVILRSAMAKQALAIRESSTQVVYGELPSVIGDVDRLLQLFEYLLDQALRRRGSASLRIEFAAERQNDAWLFTVSDNGAAMADAQERAFTPFARLHSNQRPGPGLAICRAIVERHGGRIWAESAGEGCMFRFTLPAE
jgi:light-regulated signal transduction histidine kinase (bacteriophytochrome)